MISRAKRRFTVVGGRNDHRGRTCDGNLAGRYRRRLGKHHLVKIMFTKCKNTGSTVVVTAEAVRAVEGVGGPTFIDITEIIKE